MACVMLSAIPETWTGLLAVKSETVGKICPLYEFEIKNLFF